MKAAAAMRTDDPMTRHDLITMASRAAFQAEVAERDGQPIEEASQRVIYHTACAELLARTVSYDAEAQEQVNKKRQDHLRRAAAYQRELDRLEGREDRDV